MEQMNVMNEGKWMYDLAARLFPIGRSLTGQGVRDSLQMIKQEIPELEIKEVSSGYQAFDWTVPKEWEITEGYIEDECGNRILDYHVNNLSVMGYSTSVDAYVTLEEVFP